MADEDGGSSKSDIALPHEHYSHADVTGGWLRASTFGAMDGLVSNTALIAGVAASAGAHTVLLTGVAGLLAGAFSMALGEFTSVRTANEQIDSEVRAEQQAFEQFPRGEQMELVAMFKEIGMTTQTAKTAAAEVHRDRERAVHFHLAQELGIDPREKPSAGVAAGSSFVFFAIGALIPLLPYLFGVQSPWPGLLFGAVGLVIAGAVAAYFAKVNTWFGAGRQLVFGSVAIAVTYLVGKLIGTAVT